MDNYQRDIQNGVTTTTILTGDLVDAQVREAVHAQTDADMPEHVQAAIMDEWITELKNAAGARGVTWSVDASQAVHPLDIPTSQVYEACEEALSSVDLGAIIIKHAS